MVDIHDRRPMMLSPGHAREWLDTELSPKHAEELAKKCCQANEDFEWFAVDKSVGNVRNQGPDQIAPLR